MTCLPAFSIIPDEGKTGGSAGKFGHYTCKTSSDGELRFHWSASLNDNLRSALTATRDVCCILNVAQLTRDFRHFSFKS